MPNTDAMFTGESLATVLIALAAGRIDDARDLVRTNGDIDDALRSAVARLFEQPGTASDLTRRLGDELRARGADRGLVNECYRVAFYAGDQWRQMSGNPLFAYFSANRSGAPLDKWVHYFPIYTRHLERYRNRSVRVLEIGVYRGGGLDMLRHYLGLEATLVGLDVDDAARDAVAGRHIVEIGDQADPTVLIDVNDRHGPFDVVIDDGGHTADQQIASIETLFPLLAHGGTYLVEDCHTSYWEDAAYSSETPDRGTFIDWAKSRIDDVNAHHFSKEPSLPQPWATSVDSIHLYDSVVALEKEQRFAPFSELTGVAELVGHSRGMSQRALDLLSARDLGGPSKAAVEVVAVRDAALVRAQIFEEKAARAQTQVSQLQSTISRLEAELRETQAAVQKMQGSRSWRITAPLRNTSSKFRDG